MTGSQQMIVELEDCVEDRIAKLGSDVQHLQADVSDIKAWTRQFQSEVLARFDRITDRLERITESMAELRTQMYRGDLQTRVWVLVSIGAVLAVMARGFKWI
jgi:hypothetical protein